MMIAAAQAPLVGQSVFCHRVGRHEGFFGVITKVVTPAIGKRFVIVRDAALPSPLTGLTSEFGMGSGVSLSLWPPGKLLRLCTFFSSISGERARASLGSAC